MRINGGEIMYKIAICEDSRIQAVELIDSLKAYGSECRIKFEIDYFGCGEDFLEKNYFEYDVIFLDVEMPRINGIEVAKEIRKTCPKSKIIFVTAYEHYWPEGYKVMASRFLIKPLKQDELTEALTSLIEELNTAKKYISARSERALEKVLIEDITYLEISGRKVLIHTPEAIYTSSYNLNSWYHRLAIHHFEYTHSSYLVNLKYVKLVARDKVTLTTGEEVYMSLRKYKGFKTSFVRYISQP